MGSWNETCALSNLPITYDDEVVYLLLSDSPYKTAGSQCYHNPVVFVRSVPLFGTYSDYGEVQPDEEQDFILEMIKDQFSKDLVETEATERDIMLGTPAVKMSNYSFDQLQDWLHEGSVRVKSNRNGTESVAVNKCMIRRDVWDATADTSYFLKYTSSGHALINEALNHTDSYFHPSDTGIFTKTFWCDPLGSPPAFCGSPNRIVKMAISKLREGKYSAYDVVGLFNRLSELAAVEACMLNNRLTWSRTGHSGSQSANFEGAMALHLSFAAIAYKEALKNAVEYGDGWTELKQTWNETTEEVFGAFSKALQINED